MPLPENRTPPYLHWHSRCPSCAQLSFACAASVPVGISSPLKPVSVGCAHCGQWHDRAPGTLVLHPGFNVETAKREPSGALAVAAGMIAGIRLARVDGAEIGRGSPRVKSAIAEAVQVTRMVVGEVTRASR